MGSPLFMRDVSLTLKLLPSGPSRVQYNCDVHLAEIVPTAGDTVEYHTLCATGTYKSVGKTSYDLHIVAAQNWDVAGGLARFLWDNDGATAEFQYQAHGSAAMPPTTALPGMAGVVQLIAGNYGGEIDNYAELDVTLPCTSKPVIATAVFPTLAEDGTVLETVPDSAEGTTAGADTVAA